MEDIQININRFTDVHAGIERARRTLASARPSISAGVSGSLALPAFKARVDELDALVQMLLAQLEADSRKILAASVQFMEADEALARIYQSSIEGSLSKGAH